MAAREIAKQFNFKGVIQFNSDKADGQYKKTVSNAKLRRLNPHYQFTPFTEAVKDTVQWFRMNSESARM